MGQADWGAAPGWLATVRAYFPRGNTLDAETFRRRHLLLCWILGLHIPPMVAFGVWQGFGIGPSLVEMATPAVCLILARLVRNRRLAAFFVTAGLVFCSSALVHLSNGMIEAHFHFFVLIGLIALYQDWVPFLWDVVFTVLSHGMGSAIAAESMFDHIAGQNSPWLWATIHGIAVLAACTGVIIFWKNTEFEQQRNSSLAIDLSTAELAAVQADAAQRRSTSELLVNLARRNQSLLNRQLALIAELEQREREPEALSELFQLDHLATRIRRNAESLLVLSGDDPPRLWGRPMPLSEVVRAAAAEVEDYERVDVLVNDYIEVAGRCVADLAHLLAELIENATTFSPPGSGVRVRSHLAPTNWSTFMLSIEDTGIGMPDADLEAANAVLSEPRDVDLRRSTLGFHVVSRLARRYGLEIRLAPTPGGGLTALVTLPNELASERREPYGSSPAPPPSAVLTSAVLSAAPVAALAPAPPMAESTAPAWTATPMPEVLFPVASSAPALAPSHEMPPPPPPPPPPVAPAPEALQTYTADGFVRRVPGAALTPDQAEPVPPPRPRLDPPEAYSAPAAPPLPSPPMVPPPAAPPAPLVPPTYPFDGLVLPVPPRADQPGGLFSPSPPPPANDPNGLAPPVPAADLSLTPPDGESLLSRPTGGFAPLAPLADDASLTFPADDLAPPTPLTPPGGEAELPRPPEARVPLTPPGGEAARPQNDELVPPVPALSEGVAHNGGAAPAETEADEAEAEPPPTHTADGLVRRVPGAGLAAALRRENMPNGGADDEDSPPVEALDREQVRSMLSQFQAGQRAGRAVADIPLDLQPPEEEAP